MKVPNLAILPPPQLTVMKKAMFVEGEVEIKIKDRSTDYLDDHDLKLWVQRAFKDLSCYRLENFKKQPDKKIRAVVSLKLSVLPENERQIIRSKADDSAVLKAFIERMFAAKGTLRCIGDPKLRAD